MRSVVVCDDPMRRALEIVELPALHAPNECSAERERQDDGERNQQEENVHCGYLMSLSALPTTSSDDSDIPRAATSGDTRPAAARGIATAL